MSLSSGTSPRPPRVSVVIPAYNAAAFLGEAVDSVLAQTYGDWEAIIADDASTDSTFDVACAIAVADARVRALRLGRNSGPAAARNVAIAASSGGELVALLDADDYWLPKYLESQVAQYDAAIAAGRRPGIVACDAVVQMPDGTSETFSERVGWLEPVTYEAMLERSYIFVSAMFTRAAYDEVGGFATDCWGSEDYDLWLRILEAGYEIVENRRAIAVYRYHHTSLSRSQLTMADAAIAAYTRALRRDTLTPRQRRAVRSRLRHYRALHQRALVVEALHARRALKAGVLALGALPHGLVAFLQAPSRWREWVADLRPRGRKPRSPGPRPDARS